MLCAGIWNVLTATTSLENKHLSELCAVYLLLFVYSASEKVRLTVPDAAVSVNSCRGSEVSGTARIPIKSNRLAAH